MLIHNENEMTYTLNNYGKELFNMTIIGQINEIIFNKKIHELFNEIKLDQDEINVEVAKKTKNEKYKSEDILKKDKNQFTKFIDKAFNEYDPLKEAIILILKDKSSISIKQLSKNLKKVRDLRKYLSNLRHKNICT